MPELKLKFIPVPKCPFCDGAKCDSCGNTGTSLGRPSPRNLRESTTADLHSLDQEFHKVDSINFVDIRITKFICPMICKRERLCARIQFWHWSDLYFYFCFGCNAMYQPITKNTWNALVQSAVQDYTVVSKIPKEVEVTGEEAEIVEKYLNSLARKAERKLRRSTNWADKVKY